MVEFCPRCGRRFKPDDTFCRNCGTARRPTIDPPFTPGAGQAATEPVAGSATPRFSDDHQWWWTGTRWTRALSDDGRWRWDGRRWLATESGRLPSTTAVELTSARIPASDTGARLPPVAGESLSGRRLWRALVWLGIGVVWIGAVFYLTESGRTAGLVTAVGSRLTALGARWPTGYLLGLSLLVFLEGYILVGRPTLGLRRYLMAFTYGAVGAVALSFIIERALTRVVAPVTLAYTVAPLVEESVKLFPILLISGFLADWRRLSVGDLALLGLASGLGFEFVEENLRVLTHGTVAVGGTAMVTPFIPGWRTLGDGLVNAAGHGIWTGTVALAVAAALALTRRRRYALVVGIVALAWVTFDHGVFNWEVAANSGGGALPGIAPQIYRLTLQGRLEVFVLPAGLLLSGVLAHMQLKRLSDHRLPGESAKAGFVSEWATVIASLRSGPAAAARSLRYFRLRQACALAVNEQRLDPRPEAKDRATYLTYLLQVQKAAISDGPGWRQWFGRLPQRLRKIPRRLEPHTVPGLILAFAFLLFSFPPGLISGRLARPLFSAPLVLGFGLLGLGYTLLQARDFRLVPRPSATNATGELLVAWDMRVLLLIGAAVLPLVSIVGWLFPSLIWAPIAGTFVTDAIGEWTLIGGVPPSSGPGAGPKKDWLAIKLTDEFGKPMPHQAYKLSMNPESGGDGAERSGVLDSNGYACEYDLDPDQWYVTFPEMDRSSWGPTEGADASSTSEVSS